MAKTATTPRVTNAQILAALGGLTETVAGLGSRVDALEGATTSAKPAKGKANTRARKAPAKTEAKPAKVKVLTRGRAKAIKARTKKYAGMTRAQMIEAGLGKQGYSLPTGELRRSLSQG